VTDGIAYQIYRVLQIQLLQDMGAMSLHGAGADDQLFGNLLVAQTSNKQKHDLPFPVREFLIARWARGWLKPGVPQVVIQEFAG
jgi:hypothetical protein